MLDLLLRYLDRKEVLAAGGGDLAKGIVDVRLVLDLMSRNQASMAAECVLPMGADSREKGYALPAWVGGAYDAAGVKWTVHRAAPSSDVPSVTSLTLLNRLADGRPLGLLESALMTGVRTAAVSALAIKTLTSARPRIAALLGAGAQAAHHLYMLCRLFPDLERIHVWNRSVVARDAMLATLAAAPPSVVTINDLREAVSDADVVLTCTSSPEPLLSRWAVRRERLIVQVGYHEVDFDAIAASDVVVVDLWGDFCHTSAKSLFQMFRAGRFRAEEVAADLVDIIVRGWRPPHGASVYFSSFGLNVFDIAIAARVLSDAQRMGRGVLLPMLGQEDRIQ
jgi:ornithine cyclodeaminase